MNPDIVWSKSYGGSEDEWAQSIQETFDHGYILEGITSSNDGDVIGIHGQTDIWILKLDENGDVQWKKTFGGSNYESNGNIIQTLDGGYIFCTSTDSNDGDVIGNHDGGDAWIVKIDSSGIIQWQKYFGGSSGDGAFNIAICKYGGYIFTGSTQSSDGDIEMFHGGIDTWVVKLDSVGNKIWSKTYGGSVAEGGSEIFVASDGGYVITSYTDSEDGDLINNDYYGIYDYWIIKLDSVGNIQWSQCFGGSNGDISWSIQQTDDENYVAAGVSRSNDGNITGHHGTTATYDYWIIKVDQSGNLLWQNSIGGTDDEYCYSIKETNDYGLIVGGYTVSDDGDVTYNHSHNSDAWIVKLDINGEIQWENCYGSSGPDGSPSGADGATSIIQSSDGSYVFFGGSNASNNDVTSNNGALDYWIVKLSSSTAVNNLVNEKSYSLYPNPAHDEINFEEKNFKGKIEICNIEGAVIYRSSHFEGEHLIINSETFPKGIYFFVVTTNEHQSTEKIQIQ